MQNSVNAKIMDLIAETARETSELAGLESLLLLLEKVKGEPGRITQTDRWFNAYQVVSGKINAINVRAEAEQPTQSE